MKTKYSLAAFAAVLAIVLSACGGSAPVEESAPTTTDTIASRHAEQFQECIEMRADGAELTVEAAGDDAAIVEFCEDLAAVTDNIGEDIKTLNESDK